jgi:3-hydroxy acid dehydrogenase/malonic semialdehyde reductase
VDLGVLSVDKACARLWRAVRRRWWTRAGAVHVGAVPLTADDIAEAAAWVVGLPPHMNVNLVEIMPVC